MSFFYDLNKKLNSLRADDKQITESVARAQAEVKTPARITLEESLKQDMKKLMEGAKPDFLDMDKDGNKKEPMKKAVSDKKKNPFAKKVDEDATGGMSQSNTLESQLNEYFIEPGDVGQIFQLNLFNDLIGENALSTDPEWKQNPKWMAVVKEFKPVALQLANEIRAAKGKQLSDEEAEELDGLMYDGSDAYEGPDAGADWLRGAYRNQAKVVSEILSGLSESSEKADKDYDKDGKVESPKAEYLGSRIAAGKRAAEKMKEQISGDDEMVEAGLPDVADKAKKMAIARGSKPGVVKAGPLKNVGKGLKAFFKGEPEPMDEVVQSKGHPEGFEFPQNGRYGYAIGGGQGSYGGMGQFRSEGLTVYDKVSRKSVSIPDFTYMDEEPTQAMLKDIFYNPEGESIDEEQEMIEFLTRKAAPQGHAEPHDYNKGGQAYNGMEFEGEEMTMEAVSRKHFQQVADLLKAIEDPAKRKEMAMHHAQIFAQQNPRFDIVRFGRAAGVDLAECGMWESLKGGQHKLDVDGDGDIGADDLADLRAGNEVDEGFGEMDAWLKQREKEKGTGRFDSRKVSTGTVYTRKPETFGDEEGSDEPVVKRGRGRPAVAKGPERVTKGAWKKKAMAEDGCCPHCGGPIAKDGELDEEKVEAGKRHFFDKLAPAAKKAAKVVKAVTGGKKEVDEESTAKKDTKAEKAGKKVAKDIEHDEGNKSKGDNKAEKAGKKVTKDIEFDDKKDKKEKEEKVDETTTSGSVAPVATGGKKSSAGAVGKGIYDSWEREFETLLAESVSVKEETTMAEHAEDGDAETMTITATGDDVARLRDVLAQLGVTQSGPSHDHEEPCGDEACGTCGGVPCQCDELEGGLPGTIELEIDEEYGDNVVDQNSPDYPTNQECSDDALQYAGGLNKPKSTGQTTIPVVASQLGRQVSENKDSVDSFLSLYQAFKTK